MQNQQDIIKFLLEAKKNTYAANTGQITSSRPASYDLSYEEGEYLYIDSYLGTHLFSGQEAVFKSGCPVWAMNYSGRVLSDNFQSKFLKNALMHPTQNFPYRGPKFFKKAITLMYSRLQETFLGLRAEN